MEMGTPEHALAALRLAGISGAPSRMLERDGRRAVFLPGDRIAWFPLDEEWRGYLARQRRVLGLLERYCSFRAPRVLYQDQEGWDVRTMVSGVSDPWDVYARAQKDRMLAARIGEALGRVLADQHVNVPAAGLEEWLPLLPDWPRAEDRDKLPKVVEDRALLARIEEALRRREAVVRDAGTRVLTHSDLGFHNIAFDPQTLDVVGVFDYDGAAFTDRHFDFKNMSLHCEDGSEPMLDAAAEIYERLTGIAIDRGRVRLLNACEAIGFLGFRFGHAPEEDWCGRTLAQDLDWADKALQAAGID
jgi:aminoglycoside phosphotransferase (APT) family kinase protein